MVQNLQTHESALPGICHHLDILIHIHHIIFDFAAAGNMKQNQLTHIDAFETEGPASIRASPVNFASASGCPDQQRAVSEPPTNIQK